MVLEFLPPIEGEEDESFLTFRLSKGKLEPLFPVKLNLENNLTAVLEAIIDLLLDSRRLSEEFFSRPQENPEVRENPDRSDSLGNVLMVTQRRPNPRTFLPESFRDFFNTICLVMIRIKKFLFDPKKETNCFNPFQEILEMILRERVDVFWDIREYDSHKTLPKTLSHRIAREGEELRFLSSKITNLRKEVEHLKKNNSDLKLKLKKASVKSRPRSSNNDNGSTLLKLIRMLIVDSQQDIVDHDKRRVDKRGRDSSITKYPPKKEE